MGMEQPRIASAAKPFAVEKPYSVDAVQASHGAVVALQTVQKTRQWSRVLVMTLHEWVYILEQSEVNTRRTYDMEMHVVVAVSWKQFYIVDLR